MAKGFRECPYCKYVGASDAQLQHHISKFHEALIAKEGERAEAKRREITPVGFNPALHNIVEGYLHGEDKSKVYETETDTFEGIIFRWRCAQCNKVLKEWFEKWTPESKERYQQIKVRGYSTYDVSELFRRAGASIGKRF